MIPALPSRPRNTDAFEDERHLLRWLVARLESPSRSDLSFRGLSESQDYVLGVVAPLIRMQLIHARAVLTLVSAKTAEAAYPIVRTMVEIWAEIAYLLQQPLALERSLGSQAWTLLCLMHPPAADSPEVREAAVALRDAFPTDWCRYETRFNQRRTQHHSGQGWSALVRTICGEDVHRLYGVLSWHSHSIAASVSDVQYQDLDGGRTRRTFNQARPEAAAAIDVCTFAVRALHASWAAFEKEYGALGTPRARAERRDGAA